jgi:hypothetical protein
MLIIKSLIIQNFRGIRLPLTINFTKGGKPTSVIVYGRNGTGKSSIVDAWEWLLTCKIDSLRKEGVSEKDFPHKSSGGDDSLVALEFSHSDINIVKSRFNKNKITSPLHEGKYSEFKNVCQHPNHLRYADLQEFVFKTKTEKYKYIARYFGLENFSKNQEGIQYALNKVNTLLRTHQADLQQRSKELKTLIACSHVSDTNILEYINAIAAKYTLPSIDAFSEHDAVNDGLAKIVGKSPITQELVSWKSFSTKLGNFYPIDISEAECEKLKTSYEDLIKGAESIKLLILSSLFEKSLEILPKLDDPNKCPVCNKTFDGDLYKHIETQHNALKLLNRKKQEFDRLKGVIENNFKSLERKLNEIQKEVPQLVMDTHGEFFSCIEALESALPAINDSFRGELKDLQAIDICSQDGFSLIAKIQDLEVDMKREVGEKIAKLEADENSKTLASDYRDLNFLCKVYIEYKVLETKVSFLERTYGHLEKVFTELTLYIQNKIQSIFDAISVDVVDYFNVLEGHNPYIKNPELKLVTGKDKAIELEIEFASEKVIPAFKFLSESQINSFGLSIFLASVKHFNTSFKFFILDDVINSFDAYKRPRVAQLFATKFKDFQILLLTHDQVFFEFMQKDFPEWQRYKFTGWDYTTGPKMMLARNYVEDIKKQIEEDNASVAGSILGRYLEWIFGQINQKMETPITYRVENMYTLMEFYTPLVKRFKEKLAKGNKRHQLMEYFDDFDSSTIFRNYCAHYKNETVPFTSTEIDGVLKKWLEIEEILFCKDCKSFIHYKSLSGDTYIKCDCGKLNLKDEVHYLPKIFA